MRLRLAWLMAASSALLLSVVVAQGAPNSWRDDLQQAQAIARQALLTLENHYPDQPLWREAIALGEAARAAAPDELAPLRFLGEVYARVGWIARSWDAWERFREMGGSFDATARPLAAQVAAGMANVRARAGAVDEAIDLFFVALELGYDDPDLRASTARLLMQARRPADALPLLERLVVEQPSEFPALLDRAEDQVRFGIDVANDLHDGIQAHNVGDRLRAGELIERAANAAPEYARAQRWAAIAAETVGDLEEARARWYQVLALLPDDAAAAGAVRRLDDAIAWGRGALALYQQGTSSLAAGNLAAAQQAFASAMALNPARPEPLVGLGRVATAQGRHDDAVRFFERAIALRPGDASLNALRARAREALAQATAPADRVELEPSAAPPAAVTGPEAPPEPGERASEDPGGVGSETPAAQVETDQPPVVAGDPVMPARVEPVVASAMADREDDNEGGFAANVAPAQEARTLVAVERYHRGVFGSGERAFWFTEIPSPAVVVPAWQTLEHRLVVHDKPSFNLVRYQVCLVQTRTQEGAPGARVCTSDATLTFQERGTYAASQRTSLLTEHDGFAWDQPIRWVLVVLADRDGVPVDDRFGAIGRWHGSPLFSLYYPMLVEYELALRP